MALNNYECAILLQTIMRQTFSDSQLQSVSARLDQSKTQNPKSKIELRSPVHVVYGGAHLFKADTPQKLGKLALKSLETYAPNFAEFAQAMWLKGADSLPIYEEPTAELEKRLLENSEKVKAENYEAWFAWTIYQRVKEKLAREAVEDFRIDFEDGYGFRADEEEDSHAISASDELADCFQKKTITPFCGFRIKSFAPETYKRAIRTLDLFLTNFLEKSSGKLPENFAVTLPKITRAEEVQILNELLKALENQHNLRANSIKIEIMIETPQAIINDKGEIVLSQLIEAAQGRCTSAHFGAYDYTSSFGIVAEHQHLRHEACNFVRQMMQISLAPLNVRLSDSVTTEMPVPVHRGENLTSKQTAENKRAVHRSWRAHFNNVTHSLIDGFYQSWDLHPAQLVPRYAAIYAFFLESKSSSAKRLKGFLDKATQAMLTGNQFDDAASAQGLLNFFVRAAGCGAMSEEEVLEASNLNLDELRTASFGKIVENRKVISPRFPTP
jgi:hypothetical protein